MATLLTKPKGWLSNYWVRKRLRRVNDFHATNSAPYIQKHNHLDKVLKILNKFETLWWTDYFTDEKNDNEVIVLTDQRMKKLNNIKQNKN